MRTALLVALALCCFAANSILCRLALASGAIDAGAFTAVRLLSGAVALACIVLVQRRRRPTGALPGALPGARPGAMPGSWPSSVALVAYALPFSLAYVRVGAGVGAFVLFGAVQLTMIGAALRQREAVRASTVAGLAVALGGLVWLTLPGASAPDWIGVALMLVAGASWGVYSLRGRVAGVGGADPTAVTAGNFARAAAFVPPIVIGFALAGDVHVSVRGVALAAASGAAASGLGYSVWYAALRRLQSAQAAVLQLLVPPMAALAAVALLSEPLSQRLVGGGALILGGVIVALRSRA